VSEHEQLSGITVLDLSSVGPASRCTGALADLGATVMKIAAPAQAGRTEPPWFAYGAGRGTRRVRIDLQDERGREVFLRLCSGADVVVESFRPGVADRLGIGYDAVKGSNPAVIYCAITGYGRAGPYAKWAGHDLNYLAVGGYLGMQGLREDGGPALPGATVADSAGGGLQAALAVAAALYRRTITGEGCFLDVSTTEGVLWLMSLLVDEYLATGTEPQPGTALLTGGFACYDVYRCRDGRWLAVAALESSFFGNLCRALGCDEWIPHQGDPSRQGSIRAAFRSAFARRDRDEWVTGLGPNDTCVAPVLSISEVGENPHLAARGAFDEIDHPERGRVRQVGRVIAGNAGPDGPARIGGEPSSVSILSGAGYTDEEIEALVVAGVVE